MVRIISLVLALIPATASAAEEVTVQNAVKRGVRFLAREVPAWKTKNKCFSCHNNGDAARALLLARQHKFPLPKNSLNETLDWLSRPDRWSKNGGEGEFNDQQLAAIQFGAALTDAVKSGAIKSKNALKQAAKRVAEFQKPDGGWSVIAAGSLGSPITYGNILSTAQARRIMHAADAKLHQARIKKADAWLRSQRPKNVFSAASLLIGLGHATDAKATGMRKSCLAIIRKGQDRSGGWGPYVTSTPESFDTALVLMALARLPKIDRTPGVDKMWQTGRRALVRMQKTDGSWPETTRPENAVSYAHRISTTGWAVQALLAETANGKNSARR